jgi:hypothetical protein
MQAAGPLDTQRQPAILRTDCRKTAAITYDLADAPCGREDKFAFFRKKAGACQAPELEVSDGLDPPHKTVL